MSLCGYGQENANGTRGSRYCGGNGAETIKSLEPVARQDILEDEPRERSLFQFLILYRVCIYLFVSLFAAQDICLLILKRNKRSELLI